MTYILISMLFFLQFIFLLMFLELESRHCRLRQHHEALMGALRSTLDRIDERFDAMNVEQAVRKELERRLH